tara:strand:+ start:14276 stop:15763 length:1488 start_codon:yes stop_codon:yes gene_type:complete
MQEFISNLSDIELIDGGSKYQHDASGFQRKINGVFLPKSHAEVQRIIQKANDYKQPVFVISGGKNWGYGTALPVQPEAWILSLEKMKRILNFDSDTYTLDIEAGVSQQDLHEYFQKHNIPAMVPNTGIGGRGNIIGNLLERGFGPAPLQDHASSLMSLKAVMADASEYSSFYRGIAGDIDRGYHWGLGPYMDGLFHQSGLGIVTEAKIKVMPKPEEVTILISEVKSGTPVATVMQACGELTVTLNGQFQASKYIDSAQIEKSAGADTSYFSKTKNPRLLYAGLYTSKKQKRIVQKQVKSILAKYGLKNNHFVNRSKLQVLKRILPKKLFEAVDGLYDLADGVPSPGGLNLLFPDADRLQLEQAEPAKHEYKILWYVPVLSLSPNRVEEIYSMMKNIVKDKEEFLAYTSFTITTIGSNAAVFTVPLIYKEENKEKVYSLYRNLLQEGAERGYFPYRIPIEFMQDLMNLHPEYWQQVQKLKKAYDPNNILSSGRYSI